MDFEASIQNFRRLIHPDHSSNFRIYVRYQDDLSSENEIFIETTINEARIISRNINNVYQNDPTIAQYCIEIPNCILAEKTNLNQLQEIVQLCLDSAIQKVHIPTEKQKLFAIIQYFLGEWDVEKLKELNIVTNQQDAIQFLETEFYELSIDYLSNHLVELIESGQANNIQKDISNKIIDSYLEIINKADNEQKTDELRRIFDKMKNANLDQAVLMHFLINIDFEEFNENMEQYFNENLNDEILMESLSRVSVIVKKQAKLMSGKNKAKVKGKVIECQFNGNEKAGLVAYFNSQYGGDALGKGIFKMRDGLGSGEDKFKKLLDPNSDHYCEDAKNSNKAWIEFDFGPRKVNLSSYTIRSCTSDHGPKSWEIAASNDQSSWASLSKIKNNTDMKSSNNQRRIECTSNLHYYQYIRFILHSSWDSSQFLIHFQYLELFGSILEPLPASE